MIWGWEGERQGRKHGVTQKFQAELMTMCNKGRMRVIPDDVLAPDIKISLWENWGGWRVAGVT